MRVSISKAAKELGGSVDTLRRWKAGGGHRRYDLAKLRGVVPDKKTAPQGVKIRLS